MIDNNAQAVVGKALLIVHGPGEEHYQYDKAKQIIEETPDNLTEALTQRLFHAGYLYRDITIGGRYKTSLRGLGILESMERTGKFISDRIKQIKNHDTL